MSTFLSYWVVETFYLVLVQPIADPDVVTVTTWLVGFHLLALGIYLLAGVAVAIATEAIGRLSSDETLLRAVATATIPALWAGHLAYRIIRDPAGESAQVVPAVVAALLVLAAAARRRIPWSTDPLAVSVLLLAAGALSSWFEVASPAGVVVAPGSLAAAAVGLKVSRTISTRPIGVLALLAVAAVGVTYAASKALFGTTMASRIVGPYGAADPNVILIVLDTVRGDHTSLAGYERDTTPNLVNLARTSTLYRDATTTAPYSLPSHASLLTGLYPRRHGAIRSGGVPRLLDESLDTIAERLGRRGYESIAVLANSGFLSPRFQFGQGFDAYDARGFYHGAYSTFSLSRVVRTVGERLPLNRFARNQFSAEEINEVTLRLLGRREDPRRPLFLFLNYMDAHAFTVPPRPFNKMYWQHGLLPSLAAIRNAGWREGPPGSPAEAYRAQYDSAITYLDFQLDLLLSQLSEQGMLENTILIVTSDHGESFGEHGRYSHAQSVFQTETGVPLLIRFPGQSQGVTVGEPVSLVDVAPTILDVAGAPSDGLDGRSLAPSGVQKERPVIVEWYDGEGYALRRGSLKLVVEGEEAPALFDLGVDPGETEDLASSRADDVESMSAELTRWLEETPLFEAEPPALKRATIDRLRTLGYLP